MTKTRSLEGFFGVCAFDPFLRPPRSLADLACCRTVRLGYRDSTPDYISEILPKLVRVRLPSPLPSALCRC